MTKNFCFNDQIDSSNNLLLYLINYTNKMSYYNLIPSLCKLICNLTKEINCTFQQYQKELKNSVIVYKRKLKVSNQNELSIESIRT